MRVGVLGSGTVGRVLGAGLAWHGNQVMLGSRNPEKPEVQQWLKENAGAEAGSFADAAKFGEFLVLATLGRAVEEALALAGRENFTGKTVMDTTNPIAAGAPVEGVLPFFTGPNESLGERIQALLPEARVVKAFNSVGSASMVNPKFRQGPPTMFLCGDNAAAKAQVSAIARQFGWEALDMGGMVAARAIEPLCMLWCIPGLRRNQWTHAFKLLAD
ncbi:MAG TPA: NAD(P)-binding domain-containing protein [Bryobacteraceae bacterium]|nr:NAD(P)-binding domain-containing protein [Bryobacteraceae bacterium]